MDFLLGSLRVVDFILLQRTLTRSTCVCNLLAQHLENELEHRVHLGRPVFWLVLGAG